MGISERTQKLMEARDRVDEKFLEFVSPATLNGNYDGLAKLALIGGRLDAIIRRNLAQERNEKKGRGK